jgi:hypothetical protein
MSVVDNTLHILAVDSSASYESWISDGTSVGTVPALPSEPLSATVSWAPSTSTISGMPLTDLSGYKIYFGPSPVALTSIIDIPDPTVLNYVVRNLAPGTLYFAVTAYINGGPESDLSTIVGAEVSASQ